VKRPDLALSYQELDALAATWASGDLCDGWTYVNGGRPALPAPPIIVVPDDPDLTGLLKGSEPPLFRYILPFEMPLLLKLRPLNPAVPAMPRPAFAA
jgi:hypothetical protein